jgi:hypothetical protein
MSLQSSNHSVEMNFGSDYHVLTFANNQYGLVDISQKDEVRMVNNGISTSCKEFGLRTGDSEQLLVHHHCQETTYMEKMYIDRRKEAHL